MFVSKAGFGRSHPMLHVLYHFRMLFQFRVVQCVFRTTAFLLLYSSSTWLRCLLLSWLPNGYTSLYVNLDEVDDSPTTVGAQESREFGIPIRLAIQSKL